MAQIALVESSDFCVEKDTFKGPMPAMHYHRSFELYYLIKGEREYFIDDQFFKISEGDLIFVPRNTLHRTAGKGASRYLVYFSDTFLQKYLTEQALAPLLEGRPVVFRADEADRERIEQILSILYTEYTRPTREQQSEAMLAGYLYQLLFMMHYTPNTYVPHDYADGRIAQVIKYINENYSQINDIEEIAERFFISKFHLCRIFNKNLGIPLVTYLNTIKIREACKMIRAGGHNLTDIAMQCGFNSSSYFCKVFKSEKGVSPTEYKKRHR